MCMWKEGVLEQMIGFTVLGSWSSGAGGFGGVARGDLVVGG